MLANLNRAGKTKYGYLLVTKDQQSHVFAIRHISPAASLLII
jgi:hypothetical protein